MGAVPKLHARFEISPFLSHKKGDGGLGHVATRSPTRPPERRGDGEVIPLRSLLCSPASLLLFLWLCSDKHVNPQPNRCFSEWVTSG